MVRRRRAKRANSGFTLLELLIVVAVIATVAMLAGPALQQTVGEHRAATAALDLVRLGRRARSESLAFGRAHLMRIDANAETVRVYRGITNSCRTNDRALITAVACGAPGTSCIDSMDLTSHTYRRGSIGVYMAITSGNALLDACYRPSGVVEFRTTAVGTFSDLNTNAGGWIVTLQREDDDDGAIGVARRILIPHGGDTRILR
jgi:prepilin-type N-terminal cleavage/methylation domain-containing protein